MARDSQSGDYPTPIIDRHSKPGTVVRLTVLAIVLVGAAVAFIYLEGRVNTNLGLGLLGMLAMIGIFYLVSTVIGFVQIMPRGGGDVLSRIFIDGHPEGTVVTDKKGRVVYANRTYADLIGANSPADVHSIEAIMSSDNQAAEAVYRLTNQVREGKEGQEEFRLLKGLGGTKAQAEGPRWYRLRARLLDIGDAGEQLHAWQLSDISAEREDQEKFFRELQHAIDYLDHAPAGFMSTGHDGAIVYINATLADWIGLDLTQFTPGSIALNDLIAGEGMALIESVEAAPGLDRTATLDLDMLRRDGKSMPVRLVHRVSAPRDGAPGESRTIVLLRGGEASGPSEAAAEMRFTRFFNNTPMAIASVDGGGKIVRTNAPFLKMFSGAVSRDDLEKGTRFETVVHEADRKLFASALEAAAEGKGDIQPVDTRHAADGERFIRFYVTAVIDDGDSKETAIVYAVETTEQKALEAQMAETQKMNAVGTLAGGIAHDFNNVLTAILLSADHLLLSLRPSDSSFADLMEIKRNANRAAVLVRQLLAFSRKQTMRPTVLSMTDVIGDLRMLVDRLTGTHVKLDIDYGKDLWPVKTDLGQFEQVIINLAVNARDAMPEGGTIRIGTANVESGEVAALNNRGMEVGDYVMIAIEDEGTGIAPDLLDKIFEPFFTTKDVGKGTGLGLSMVYGIIKQSGGYIYPESEVGKGSTFRIYLPRHIETEEEAASDSAEDKQEAGAGGANGSGGQKEPTDLTGSATVLLVEDEEAVRRGGKRMLETRGYTVHEAGSGVEALDVIKELDGDVDIVVSDVVMPEMDGPTLLRELRKEYPDMKFIFVSGYAEDAFAKNLPENAQFGFLPKPFSLKQLATAVKEVIDS
ncbi:cell cycle histidine kinase CckA [Hoeflea poritis]|uniref:histidine kinase n=1 Tax=Hoeflea poritis TaxID=2993659 RepID=A0ABT4VU69_9HYPH|nr:response regulator [Hoeflea poritis]MDA4848246.1 response regulator [Hoeflea poritis]